MILRRLRAFCWWRLRAFVREEKLPKGFARDPAVANAVFDPIEDIRQHRVRHLTSPFRPSC